MKTTSLLFLAAALVLHNFAFAQTPAFPLKVSDNGRYFTDQSGKPFLYHADTGWQLFARLTENEAREYLITRSRQKFNAIQVMLSVNPDSSTRQGQLPFVNYNFAEPNPKYFDHVSKIISIADSLGLLLNIAPFWIGCCREGYGVGAKVEMFAKNGTEKSRQLGQWIGKKFGRFSNIIWTMGGDNDPLTIRKEMEAFADGLRIAIQHPLISYHARPPHSSTDLFQYAPWLNYSMIYTYWREKPNEYVNSEQMVHVYEAALREYLKSDNMPFILGESQYEGSGTLYGNDIGIPRQIRRQAYWTILCGGTGEAYGQDGWSFPENWRDILQYPGAKQLGYMKEFFDKIKWWQLEPDYAHKAVLHGYGDYTRDNYVTTAVSNDKKMLVSYLPYPGALTINFEELKGSKVTVQWFDPRTGEYKNKSTLDCKGIAKLYSPPQEDWVLLIEVL